MVLFSCQVCLHGDSHTALQTELNGKFPSEVMNHVECDRRWHHKVNERLAPSYPCTVSADFPSALITVSRHNCRRERGGCAFEALAFLIQICRAVGSSTCSRAFHRNSTRWLGAFAQQTVTLREPDEWFTADHHSLSSDVSSGCLSLGSN